MAAQSRWGLGAEHIFTLLGICLGVMALITVSSVMNGFREDISGRIVGTLSQMRLSGKDGARIEDYEKLIRQVEAEGFKAAPVVRLELMLKSESEASPAVCFGIDAVRQQRLSPVLNRAEAGEGILAGELEPGLFQEEGGIILGAGLAQNLGVYLGDEVLLISPNFSIPTAFGLLPQLRRLTVQAIFGAGMPEYDQNFCYIPLEIAQAMSGAGMQVDYLELKGAEHSQSRKYIKRLAPLFPDYELEDWSSFDRSLYFAIRFEKFLMFVILLFMFIIASFNLTGSLLKIISQKKRELGLLKAIGYEDRELRRLFLLQGLILCTLGIALGIVLSLILLGIQASTGLIRLSGHIVLPVHIQLLDFVIVITISYILTIISVQWPLKQLSEIDAVELIRRNV